MIVKDKESLYPIAKPLRGLLTALRINWVIRPATGFAITL